jgi:hypothetical protein
MVLKMFEHLSTYILRRDTVSFFFFSYCRTSAYVCVEEKKTLAVRTTMRIFYSYLLRVLWPSSCYLPLPVLCCITFSLTLVHLVILYSTVVSSPYPCFFLRIRLFSLALSLVYHYYVWKWTRLLVSKDCVHHTHTTVSWRYVYTLTVKS